MTDTLKPLVLAATLAARFAERADAHDRVGTFAPENFAELHASGFLRLVLPREFGGAAADLPTLTAALERLAHGDGGTALALAMHVQLVGRLRDEGGWPAPLFETVCRALAEHGGLVNSVVTEPELGSISRGGTPATTATPVAGGFTVRGRKSFATGAPALRYLLVAVTLPPSAGAAQGETANALIPADAPGLTLVETWGDGLGMRTSGSHDFVFEDVFVPEGWLFGRRAVGAPLPAGQQPGLNAWGLIIAAVYLGIGQAAADAAADYANSRVPSGLGKPIAELPHIQQQLGALQIPLLAARTLIAATVQAWQEHPDQRAALSSQVAAAKYLATNAACAATEGALRVAGGFSLGRALPLERHFRDARAGLFNPPQDDLALAAVGRALIAERRG